MNGGRVPAVTTFGAFRDASAAVAAIGQTMVTDDQVKQLLMSSVRICAEDGERLEEGAGPTHHCCNFCKAEITADDCGECASCAEQHLNEVPSTLPTHIISAPFASTQRRHRSPVNW